jgi:hypothetical protein
MWCRWCDDRRDHTFGSLARLTGALDITGLADAGIQKHLFKFALAASADLGLVAIMRSLCAVRTLDGIWGRRPAGR